jgi:hypothetical protein
MHASDEDAYNACTGLNFNQMVSNIRHSSSNAQHNLTSAANKSKEALHSFKLDREVKASDKKRNDNIAFVKASNKNQEKRNLEVVRASYKGKSL